MIVKIPKIKLNPLSCSPKSIFMFSYNFYPIYGSSSTGFFLYYLLSQSYFFLGGLSAAIFAGLRCVI